jgi:ABC-type transport system involved in multi-copper enzyme maturation permease subunit
MGSVLAIAGKELRENVLSRRFQIALAITVLLLGTSIVALAVNHRQDLEAFQVRQADLQQVEDPGGFSTVNLEVSEVLKRPNPLAVFVGGPGERQRSEASVSQGSGAAAVFVGGSGSAQPTSGSASPTSLRFAPVDLAVIAVVIMTFMAVLFAYDAVSGERERGTLKLVLANPVPRDAVLLGKYLGGMASVLLPFLVSAVVAVALFQAMGIHLTDDEWLRLGLLLLLVVPLLSAFYLIGLAVSSLTRRSGTSLLALLLVWMVLAFGAGNVAAAVAKSAHGGEGDAQLLREFQAIREDEQSQLSVLQSQMFPLMQGGGNQSRVQELQDQMRAVFEASQARRDAAVEAARRQQDGQLRLAERIATLSPAEAWRSLATTLARTDYGSFVDQRDAATRYLREVERERAEWNRENGGMGNVVRIGPGGFVDAQPAGRSFEPPEFGYRPPSVGEQLGWDASVQSLAVLLGSNLAAFGGAYAAFRRYDVR